MFECMCMAHSHICRRSSRVTLTTHETIDSTSQHVTISASLKPATNLHRRTMRIHNHIPKHRHSVDRKHPVPDPTHTYTHMNIHDRIHITSCVRIPKQHISFTTRSRWCDRIRIYIYIHRTHMRVASTCGPKFLRWAKNGPANERSRRRSVCQSRKEDRSEWTVPKTRNEEEKQRSSSATVNFSSRKNLE